jgi:DNA-binding MarR family transcriptional regulator
MLLNEEQSVNDDDLLHHQSPDRALHVVRRLRRAFLSICRCGDVLFSPYRLTTEQYALMRAVQRKPGIRQTELTAQIFAEPNTVTAMVSLLEKRGIVRRRSSPADGRVRLLYLTSHGQTVMQRLSEDWKPMRELLKEAFAGEAGQKALEILDQVYDKMQREREYLLRQSNPDRKMEMDREDAGTEEMHPAQTAVRGGLAGADGLLHQPVGKAKSKPGTK